MMRRLSLYWEFSRPFTLLAPALGMLSGGLAAVGAAPASPLTGTLGLNLLFGTLMAVAMNAGSNALNQIYDLDVDRVNKPDRALPSGRISISEAYGLTAVLFALGLALAWAVNVLLFVLALGAILFTAAYSIPPARTKSRGLGANLTIAIPRGVGLKIAGWACVKSIFAVEPWAIGLVFGLFLLGTTSTKDFADIEGDKAGGCRTLPIVYGVRRAAWLIAPFFVLPFLLLPLGAGVGILTGNRVLLSLLGLALSAWGSYVAFLIVKDPRTLTAGENHASWKHMYGMLFVAQIGLAAAYLL